MTIEACSRQARGSWSSRGESLGRRALLPSTGTLREVVLFAVITLCYATHAPGLIFGSAVPTGQAVDGDSTKQALFVAAFCAAAIFLVRQSGVRSLFWVPAFFLPALAWFWLSVLWAIDPMSAVRRIAFTTIVILTVSYALRDIPFERAIGILASACAVAVLADWVAVAVFPRAIHMANEIDMSIVGTWRGVHQDKNEAGGFLAMTFLVLLRQAIRHRSWLTGGVLLVLTVGFLWMSQSKTALALLAVAILLGLVIQLCYEKRGVRRAALLMIAGVAVPVCLISWNLIVRSAEDVLAAPDSFTGRVQIWLVLIDYAAKNPLLGSGYGSFWGTGDRSPVLDYTAGWLTNVFQGHNGYLDILAQTGAVGLALVVVGLIIRPLYDLLYAPLEAGASRWLLASMLIFGWLRDLMETSFMDRATSIWPLMIVAYCLTSQKASRASPPEICPPIRSKVASAP
jgi:O-antigen ligase